MARLAFTVLPHLGTLVKHLVSMTIYVGAFRSDCLQHCLPYILRTWFSDDSLTIQVFPSFLTILEFSCKWVRVMLPQREEVACSGGRGSLMTQSIVFKYGMASELQYTCTPDI
jgi:hypothetical protein